MSQLKRNPIGICHVMAACVMATCVGLTATTSRAATLLLDLNAQTPGNSSATRWVPVVGDDGTNAGILTSNSQVATRVTSGSIAYYNFTHTATDNSTFPTTTTGASLKGFEKASNANLYFEKSSAYTLEVLVRPGISSWTAANTSIGALIGSQGGAVGYSLTLSSTNTSNPTAYNVSFTAARNGSNQVTLNTSGAPVNVGDWTSIIATYDGAGVLAIYINGALAIKTTSAQAVTNLNTLSTITTNVPTTDSFAIGQRDATKLSTSAGNALWYGGDMALARVYSGALSAQEVATEYTYAQSLLANVPEPASAAFLTLGCTLLIRRHTAK